MRRFAPFALTLLASCSSGNDAVTAGPDAGAPDVSVDAPIPPRDAAAPSTRGFPVREPWLSFYGSARDMVDPTRVSTIFRIINIDADPDTGNFSEAQIATLRAGGANRVISYLNLGACESFRGYWASAPGFKSCKENTAAQLGPYAGYPDETWMNVGDADYQRLLVEYVAPRIAQRGVDGFFLDNLEIVEHGTATTNGPCDAACSQGGLDLVRKLREKFPTLLIVMQNATGAVTRLGKTGGLDFPTLLDGVTHEEVYQPAYDSAAEAELTQWNLIGLKPGGNAFFVGTEDYVQDCANTAAARSAYTASRAKGFSPYATDKSAGQKQVCYWGF